MFDIIVEKKFITYQDVHIIQQLKLILAIEKGGFVVNKKQEMLDGEKLIIVLRLLNYLI